MSAEAFGRAGEPRGHPQRPGRELRPVAGVLKDGTPFFAPVGQVITDGELVVCHLCGRSFRSVVAHLAGHRWTKEQYCEAFGLERSQPLEGPETRKLRAAAFTARLMFEPAVREGSAAGRRRARTGDLTRDAAEAARGRPFPQQRRRKIQLARPSAPSAAARKAARDRADVRLAAVADEAARRQGYPDIRAFVTDRFQCGASLAAISREAGLHKDWLSRHLARIDAAAAEAARRRAPADPDDRWLPALHALGYPDVPTYLRERHVVQHRSVNAIADEVGLSYQAVRSALHRHRLAAVAHAGKRHQARRRADSVAASMGYPTVAAYVASRRSGGWTWQAISAEAGQPETWLRRHAAVPAQAGRLSRRPPFG
jgi:protein-disulfide isomerase-like protein with CxxC motif